MTNAVGCDLARYEVFFNPSTATGPIDFAFQKATEGYSYVDTCYDEIWKGLQQIGIRGAYHYQRSGLSWLAQADHFLETVAKHNYHIYALDVEQLNNTFTDSFFQDTKRIIDYWQSNVNKKVLIYTNGDGYKQMYLALCRSYGQEYATKWLDSTPLWLADPTVAGMPVLPAYRKTWEFHQYSWGGLPSRWGTGGKAVDENVFNGTLQELQSWLGLTATPPQGGETEVSMSIYQGTVTVSAGVTLQIRSTPAVETNNDVGDLHYGDKVEASEITGGWWKLTKVNGISVSNAYAFSNNGAWIRTDAVLPDTSTDIIFVDLDIDVIANVSGKQYHGAVMLDSVQLKPV